MEPSTSKSCSNRSHLHECFIKVLWLFFLLTSLLCFHTENPRFFSGRRTTPNCPGRNNSHFALEYERSNMSLVFLVLASSLVLFVFGHGVKTSNLGVYQHKNSVKQAGTSHWNKLELPYLPPARMKVGSMFVWETCYIFVGVNRCFLPPLFSSAARHRYTLNGSNSLNVYTAKHASNSRKVQEDKLTSPCAVCDLVGIFRNRKGLFWDLPISVLKLQEYRTLRSCHAVPADRRNKTLEWRLAMVNASSAIMVTCFGTNKCCSNRSHLQELFKRASSDPPVLLASQGYSFQVIFQWVFPLYTLQFPSISVSCWLLFRHSVRSARESTSLDVIANGSRAVPLFEPRDSFTNSYS